MEELKEGLIQHSVDDDLEYLNMIEEAEKDAEKVKELRDPEEYIYIDPDTIEDINHGVNKILVNELNKRKLTVTEAAYQYQKILGVNFTKARTQFYNDKQILSKNKNMTLQTLFRLCELLHIQVDFSTGD